MAPRSGSAQDPRARPAYWVILFIAAVDLAVWAWNATRPVRRARLGPSGGWLLPVALLVVAVGGLLGARHPRVQRAATVVALVLMVGALWQAFTR